MTPLRSQLPLKDISNFFIDGEWVAPATPSVTTVICPYDKSPLCAVAEGQTADIDRAVTAARMAFDYGPWPRMEPHERAAYLGRLGKALLSRSEELVAAWVEQVGVPLSFAKGAPGYAVSALTACEDLALAFPFVEPRTSFAGPAFLYREPVGVVAAIAPWNAPLVTMLNKIAPALLAGCTVIMKPAPQTPLDAYVIAACAAEVGFPNGVINLVTADRDASDHLVRHPGVDKVSFTGSVATGRRIAANCAERIARCTLELGGKSAAIILDDYDLAAAAQSIASGIAMLTGQNCAALSRVIVSKRRHDQFTEALVQALQKIKVGNPYDPTVQMGPLAMERQLRQVERYLEIGKAEGANIALEGARPDGLENGYYIGPSVFSGVEPKMKIAQEEIFGPVLCVIPCVDEANAVEIANDSIFGLAGAVYTNNTDNALAMARQIRTGTIGHNGPLTDFSIGFGGYKQSGIGREGGREGLLPYLEAKTVLLSGALATS